MADKTSTTQAEKRRTRSLSKGYVDLIVELRKTPNTVFDVVIVGSGYGGSVAAQQLAGLMHPDGKPLRIAVLERGNEYLPGMFPSAFADLPKHVRFATQSTGKVTGELDGLYDVRLGNDVNALVANGLGGGSLINAGVMLEPDFKSFASALPSTLIDALCEPAKGGYLQEAKKLLLKEPLNLNVAANTIREHGAFDVRPNGNFPLKFKRLKELAKGGKKVDEGVRFEAAEISVAMQPVSANEHSIKLNACVACGDCMTGCNIGAKASLNTNLLAQAKRDGVEIYTGASVLSMRRIAEEEKDKFGEKNKFDEVDVKKIWQLDVVHTSLALRKRSPSSKKSPDLHEETEAPLALRAHHVILAAGTFGSTEILLRSRSPFLVFSNKLGEKFSCNGDNIAAIHNMPERAHCTDDEFQAIGQRNVGPTITGTIKVPKKGSELGYLIQEFAVPGPLKRIFEELVTTTKVVNDLPTKDKDKHGYENPDAHDVCAVNPDAMDKTVLLGIIGHDDAKGVLQLPLQLETKGIRDDQEGVLQIIWPEARKSSHLDAAYRRLTEYCKSAFDKATVISNPMWRFLPEDIEMIVKQERGPVLTVHPLGGCTIGSSKTDGVVNDYGVVFDAGFRPYDEWQGTLMVLDGSIIPGSLGANPSLTISAIALRAIENFIAQKVTEKKFKPAQVTKKEKLIDEIIFAQARPAIKGKPQPTEIKITERLSGKVTLMNEQTYHEDYVVELTLAYEPKELHALMSKWGSRRQKVATGSYLRLFKYTDWEDGPQLRVADDVLRQKNAVLKVEVGGHLDFFDRERKTCWSFLRAAWALFINRAMRDVWNYWFHSQKEKVALDDTLPQKKSWIAKKWIFLKAVYRVIHRASEVRTFKYELDIIPSSAAGQLNAEKYFSKIFENHKIQGEKRLTYNRRANPWYQMLEMRLSAFPCMHLNKNALLKVDTRFLANQNIALAEFSKQENQMNALLDMASFGLFMARVIFNNHILSFRMPDALLSPTIPKRLPGELHGLPPPEITEIMVSKKDTIYNKPDAAIRLTRYRGKGANHPVVFIHGYSANGTTFAHPSLKPSIAEYLWKNDSNEKNDWGARDVWILDLRTSSGMPTATQAWSYEDAALVDIPVALLHIKNVTGKKVDVVAHCVGAAMLSMAILTRASDIKTGNVQLGVDTFIPDEQLGILSAFNGDGRFLEGAPVSEQHPTINSIVLSQKSPLIRYTEENIFRAYMMKYLQRWIAPEGYAFRTSDSPTAAEQLINRILSTLPYPDDEYDIENPAWPCARTEWVTSRHRMDALYGRAFNAKAMTGETLNCIDDFFGPMNMETLLQTIHFVRFNCITNQRGRGEFVSLKNLKNRWYGIPTFSIHGADNGMVDHTTYILTKTNFVAAGIPYAGKVYPDHGHQDLFIGEDCGEIFADIKEFLDNPAAKTSQRQVAQQKLNATANSLVNQWHIETPWIGPRLKVNSSGNLEALVLSSPKYGKAQLIFIPTKSPSKNNYVRDVTTQFFVAAPLSNQEWHAQDIAMAFNNNAGKSWLILMAYAIDQTLIDPANGSSTNFVIPPALLGVDTTSKNNTLATAIDDWLQANGKNLDHCVIASDAIECWQKRDKTSFNFALSSCQYPPGVMDREISEASMQAIAKLFTEADAIDFAIFAGDQIYADATAGLMDPTRKDERLNLPYEVAFRSKPLQEIMRRVPIHMLLDDHEIVDNWEPRKASSPVMTTRRERSTSDNNLKESLLAYWKYQRADPVIKPNNVLDKSVSYSFEHGDSTFYMLDTRSKREYRSVGKPLEAKMFSDAAMANLCTWLLDNKEKIKFIITPSMLLPRNLAALNNDLDHPSREDSWGGYLGTMHQIFLYILDHNIQNTVFLSGDEHMCCYATVELSSQIHAKKSKIASAHASGLYTPFPFANGKKEDFVQGTEIFDLNGIACKVTATYLDNMNFAKICVNQATTADPSVVIEYHGAGPASIRTSNLLL